LFFPLIDNKGELGEDMKNILSRRTIGLSIIIALFICILCFSDEREYKIGVDDVIEIIVWQHPQFSIKSPVGPDGKITIPLLGNIYVLGLTRDEIKVQLVEGLSKYIREGPEVTVNIAEFRSQKISIFGQVKNARTIRFSTPPSFLEVMVQSDFTPDADLTAVKLIPSSPSTNVVIVNFSEALQTGDFSNLPELHSGDTIYVPKAIVPSVKKPEEEPARIPETTVIQDTTIPPIGEKEAVEKFVIHVMGMVRTPGTLEFTKKPTLTEVLLKAGSTIDNEALKYVRIIRRDPETTDRIVDINMDEYLNTGKFSILPELFSGDLVYIPDITQDQLKDISINITGEVLRPGTYRTRKPLNILDAISLAGGLTPEANPEIIKVRREVEDSFQEKTINIEKFLSESGDVSSLPEMIGPGYSIYVPKKDRPIIKVADAARGLLAFLVDLTVFYSFIRLIRD